MDLQIGKLTGFEIKENRDGANKVLLLQVEVTDSDDIRTIEYYQAAGQDSNPPIDSLIAFLSAGSAWAVSLGANDEIEPTSDSGEYKIYSSLAGAIKAFFKLFKTGLARLEAAIVEIAATGKIEMSGSTIDLNGNTDFAVRFSVLQTAFNQLLADYNVHAHGASPTTDTPSSAAIAGAKVSDVRVS
ncbi:hypothetical protein KAR10_02795 [bacterium]|nr:hypothetical protein [bacterium]